MAYIPGPAPEIGVRKRKRRIEVIDQEPPVHFFVLIFMPLRQVNRNTVQRQTLIFETIFQIRMKNAPDFSIHNFLRFAQDGWFTAFTTGIIRRG